MLTRGLHRKGGVQHTLNTFILSYHMKVVINSISQARISASMFTRKRKHLLLMTRNHNIRQT